MKHIFLLSLVSAMLLFSSCADKIIPPQPLADGELGTDADGNVTMGAPAPGTGMQIVIAPFEVPTGGEVQTNHYFKLPNDVPFNVGRIKIAMNSGTHHMNFFRSNKDFRDTAITDIYAKVFNDGDMMIEAQRANFDWTVPENAAIRVDPHQQVILQTHYVNATSQSTPNGKGKIIINLYNRDNPSGYASMLFATNPRINIPPHTDTAFTKYCLFQQQTSWPIHILGMTGHFHGRGKEFLVERYDLSSNTVIDTIYRSAAWDEPPFEGYDPPLLLQKGQCIRYTTKYSNPSDRGFTFGPHVETDEHSNLFLWFTPGIDNGRAIYDNQ